MSNASSDLEDCDKPTSRSRIPQTSRKRSKISMAPLHLAYPIITTPTQETLANIAASGYTFNRGKFTEKENKRLKKNWKRFIKEYPNYNEPCIAFGLGTKDLHNPRKKKDFRKMKIVERMAYKLDNRLLFDIYLRCRNMFAFKEYTYSSVDDLTPKLRKIIAKKLKIHDNIEISREFDMCPDAVRKLRLNPTPAKKRHRWTIEDIHCLETIVGELQQSDKEISWHKVSKRMKRIYGLKLNREQCYKKWAMLRRKEKKMMLDNQPEGIST